MFVGPGCFKKRHSRTVIVGKKKKKSQSKVKIVKSRVNTCVVCYEIVRLIYEMTVRLACLVLQAL